MHPTTANKSPGRSSFSESTALMEISVGQAKKAYDQYVAGVERFLTSMEDANRIAWSGARDVNVRFMTFVDENARAGFEHAKRLAKAKDASEIMSMQQEYFKQQSQRLSAQMREVNGMSRKATRDAGEAAKPKS